MSSTLAGETFLTRREYEDDQAVLALLPEAHIGPADHLDVGYIARREDGLPSIRIIDASDLLATHLPPVVPWAVHLEMDQKAAIHHSLSSSVPESIIRREIPPRNPINAPVNPVMTSTASNFHPIQAVNVQNIVAATILARICGRKAVIFIT
jgi:hypothetical protein